MTATILFVSGGEDLAAEVYEDEQRGAWAEALPLALETFGFVGVHVAGPEALSDPDIFKNFAVLLISRQSPSVWTDELVSRALEGPAYSIVEGPPPAPIREALKLSLEPTDERDGVLSSLRPALMEMGLRYGTLPDSRVEPPIIQPVSRPDELHWQNLSKLPFDEPHAERWRRDAWDVEIGTVGNAETLIRWTPMSGGPSPAVVRRDHLVACCLGLFALVGFSYTSVPPAAGTTFKVGGILRTETVLMALIDLVHRWSGIPRPRILSWPGGAAWVRSVRHDYDRPITLEHTAEVLKRHAAVGSRATWYWRSQLADDGALKLIRDASGHEVALHTEALWTDTDERKMVETALGSPVVGASAHGTDASFRWQGAANVIWAEQQALLYTEHLDQEHFHPHRFMNFLPGGRLEPVSVIGLPHHRSYDRSTTVTHAGVVRREPFRFIAANGLLQVMNHPDVHGDTFFDVLAEMPPAGRLDLTMKEAIDWWRRTHVKDNLWIERSDEGFSVHSREDVEDLVVEVLDPNGFRILTTLSVVGGGIGSVVYQER